MPAWPLLGPMLRMAVPLWVRRRRDWTRAELHARASECATVLGESGDVLMFGNGAREGRKPGATVGRCGDAFNHMAEGMACAYILNGTMGDENLERMFRQLERGD